MVNIKINRCTNFGPGSSVGIATDYGLVSPALRICTTLLLIGFACWVTKTTNTPAKYVQYYNAVYGFYMLDNYRYKHALRICTALLFMGFACWII